MNPTSDEVLDWLLDGDPAIRWQVLRDLLDEPEDVWRAEQDRVATSGWGAQLLAHRDDTGRWTARMYGTKWISTTYSMLSLRLFGLPPADVRAAASAAIFLDEGLSADGGIHPSASGKVSETCVTGMVLGIVSRFRPDDPRCERLVDYVLAEQMPDGGWNCRRNRGEGTSHSSFHTTANVLDGLREYANAGTRDKGGAQAAATIAAESRAREFLLQHGLYRSHRTGNVVDPRMARLTFPPYYYHDVLRCLDHFQAANAPRDERLQPVIDLLEGKRRADGRWLMEAHHPGQVWFEMEKPRTPSRWNTMRALRVVRWWERNAR